MDVLEEEVNKLKAEKAAIEASNEELKRQNKYWEDLFSKQQLQGFLVTPQAHAATKAISVPES
jgi:FtsZ-binding cell division protein ZapB